MNRFERNLRENLLAVVGGNPSPSQLSDLVIICQKLAVVSLRQKKARMTFREEVLGLKVEDAAYDCVAELFRRDEGGEYVQFRAYFGGLDLSAAGDEYLISQLRRLVFAKVNEGLARMYQEADPVLSRILRNIRLAVSSLRNFDEVERFGEVYLLPTFADPLEHLPTATTEDLERLLSGAVQPGTNAPTVLNNLARLLNGQEQFSRIISPMGLAMAIRSIHSRLQAPVVPASEAHPQMAEEDILSALDHALQVTRDSMDERYVRRKKIPPNLFDSYFTVVRKYLSAKLLCRDGNESSLFNLARMEIPGLTRSAYRLRHRARLEYLLKMTQDRTREVLSE